MTAATEEIVKEVIRIGRQLLDEKCREALAAAGATVDDLITGRVKGERRMKNHPECNGTGMVVSLVPATASVKLCDCLEIIITRST